VAGIRKNYCSITSFFDGPTEFDEEPQKGQTFEYKCKICTIEGFYNHKQVKCHPG
jgi:hypothetical protein